MYDPNFQHDYIRTPLGGFINHSEYANCELVDDDENNKSDKRSEITEQIENYFIKLPQEGDESREQNPISILHHFNTELTKIKKDKDSVLSTLMKFMLKIKDDVEKKVTSTDLIKSWNEYKNEDKGLDELKKYLKDMISVKSTCRRPTTCVMASP